MGQITIPTEESIILSDVDRLVAANSDGGVGPAVAHIILFGEAAGQNLAASGVIALGAQSAKNVPATASNMIVLGQNSGNGFKAPGAIILGAGSLNGAFATVAVDDLISIGNRNMPLLVSQSVLTDYPIIAIGSDIAPLATTKILTRSIFIGSEMMMTDSTAGAANDSIWIGHGIRRNGAVVGATNLGASVFIGNNILRDNYVGTTCTNAVYIGAGVMANTASGGFQAADSVLIGAGIDCQSASTAATADYSVVIGGSSQFPNSLSSNRTYGVALGYANSISADYAIIVGTQTTSSRGTSNTIIGSNNNFGAATYPNLTLIGNGHTTANFPTPAANDLIFAVAPNATNWLLYGNGRTGNIVLGRSPNGEKNLDSIGATNALKLTNGTGGADPLSGGYFYAEAGEVKYVASGGRNWNLTPGPTTVAALAAIPATQGQRRTVTDALAPAFGAAVAGGGAVVVPVFWNGTAWMVG